MPMTRASAQREYVKSNQSLGRSPVVFCDDYDTRIWHGIVLCVQVAYLSKQIGPLGVPGMK